MVQRKLDGAILYLHPCEWHFPNRNATADIKWGDADGDVNKMNRCPGVHVVRWNTAKKTFVNKVFITAQITW